MLGVHKSPGFFEKTGLCYSMHSPEELLKEAEQISAMNLLIGGEQLFDPFLQRSRWNRSDPISVWTPVHVRPA